MRLVKSITAWGIVAALGYAGGVGMIRTGITAQDANSILKASAIIFASASFSLGVIFKIVQCAPPKDLDDDRKDRWTKLLSTRWKILWGRWVILLIATFVSSLSFLALDNKFSLVSSNSAIALEFASLAVALVATILSVHEIFHIQRTIDEVNSSLRDRKNLQDTLARLEGQQPESEKTARV